MNKKQIARHRQGMHTTRSARARREMLLRAGVWVFIFIFAFSVAGGLIIIGQQLAAE